MHVICVGFANVGLGKGCDQCVYRPGTVCLLCINQVIYDILLATGRNAVLSLRPCRCIGESGGLEVEILIENLSSIGYQLQIVVTDQYRKEKLACACFPVDVRNHKCGGFPSLHAQAVQQYKYTSCNFFNCKHQNDTEIHTVRCLLWSTSSPAL